MMCVLHAEGQQEVKQLPALVTSVDMKHCHQPGFRLPKHTDPIEEVKAEKYTQKHLLQGHQIKKYVNESQVITALLRPF